MQIQSVQQNQSESNKKTVNHTIRIYVNCGNATVNIQNCRMFCKYCGSFFDVEKKHDE